VRGQRRLPGVAAGGAGVVAGEDEAGWGGASGGVESVFSE